jgi:hypothetical protein
MQWAARQHCLVVLLLGDSITVPSVHGVCCVLFENTALHVSCCPLFHTWEEGDLLAQVSEGKRRLREVKRFWL